MIKLTASTPALPKLPISFGHSEEHHFEFLWAPLSFFCLARLFNLVGGKENREELHDKIEHLTKLYELPEKTLENLVSFSTTNTDWEPRVAEIVGVRALQSQLSLSESEYRIVAFSYLCSTLRLMECLLDFLYPRFNNRTALDVISKLIGVPPSKIKTLTNDDSTLTQMQLLGPTPGEFVRSISDKLRMSAVIAQRITECQSVNDDLLTELVTPCAPAKLKLEDFKYLGNTLTLLQNCIENATQNNATPMSVLFVGAPGTGKTELAKALSQHAKAHLFDVPVTDNEDHENISTYRLSEFIRMSSMLSGSPRNHILFDEVEDVLVEKKNQEKRKGWINQLLEQRKTTTYWICNDVRHFDSAFLRRFDYVLDMPKLNFSTAVNLLTHAFQNQDVSLQTIKNLAAFRVKTPASVAQIKQLTNRLISSNLSAEEVIQINHNDLPTLYSDELGQFDFSCIPIESELTKPGIEKFCVKGDNIRLLICGVSGSGKTALARYLCYDCNGSMHFIDSSAFIYPDQLSFEEQLISHFDEATTNNQLLAIDKIDQILTAIQNVMPDPESAIHILASKIRKFCQPLVVTVSNERVLQNYPIIESALDYTVTLKPWPSSTIRHFARKWAQESGFDIPRIEKHCTATPQQLIQAMRKCRLSGTSQHLNQALISHQERREKLLERIC